MHDAVAFATYLKKTIFPESSYAVAAVSYRGYPNALGTRSGGKPSQATLYADSLTLYDTLQQQLKPAHTSVVAYSIGTTVAVNLAIQRPVARMALFAPPASIRRIIHRKYPWLPLSLVLRNPFATEDIIGNLKTPTTIFYATEDEVVPVEDITTILHAANPSIPLIPLAGNHNHITLLSSPDVPRLLSAAMKSPLPGIASKVSATGR
jgi:pimeloyl-ACP methyl ester carboxylesterase